MAAHRCGLAHSKVNAPRRGWHRRLSAFAVAAALAFTAVPAQAFAAPDASEVERLYTEGQERKEAKDFKGAAESWTRLLNLLPESGENQEIRESVLINVLDSHIAAYNQLVDAEGGKDIRHLQRGEDTLNEYYSDFQRVHGDRVAISAAVQDSATTLEKLLAEARKKPDEDVTPPPPGPGDTTTTPPPPGPAPATSAPVDTGLGLLIGGVALGVVGIGGVIMIPVGSSLGKTAEEDYNTAQAARTDATNANDQTALDIANADVDDANKAGSTANAVLISGAVIGPLFLAGSAALIVLGVRKRRSAMSSAKLRPRETLTAAPTVNRRFTGVALSGRF